MSARPVSVTFEAVSPPPPHLQQLLFGAVWLIAGAAARFQFNQSDASKRTYTV